MFVSTLRHSLELQIETESMGFIRELHSAAMVDVKLKRLVQQLPQAPILVTDRIVVFLLRTFAALVTETRGVANRAKIRLRMTRMGCLLGCLIQTSSPMMDMACKALITLLVLMGIGDVGVEYEEVDRPSKKERGLQKLSHWISP